MRSKQTVTPLRSHPLRFTAGLAAGLFALASSGCHPTCDQLAGHYTIACPAQGGAEAFSLQFGISACLAKTGGRFSDSGGNKWFLDPSQCRASATTSAYNSTGVGSSCPSAPQSKMDFAAGKVTSVVVDRGSCQVTQTATCALVEAPAGDSPGPQASSVDLAFTPNGTTSLTSAGLASTKVDTTTV